MTKAVSPTHFFLLFYIHYKKRKNFLKNFANSKKKSCLFLLQNNQKAMHYMTAKAFFDVREAIFPTESSKY